MQKKKEGHIKTEHVILRKSYRHNGRPGQCPKRDSVPGEASACPKLSPPHPLTKTCAQLGRNAPSNTRHRVGTGNIKTVEGASAAINSKGGKSIKTDTQRKRKKKKNNNSWLCVSNRASPQQKTKKTKKRFYFCFCKTRPPSRFGAAKQQSSWR